MTNMKHSKLNGSRKKAIKALYKLCLEHRFTIVGTADFHDKGEEDRFEVDVGTSGVEIECLPKEQLEPEEPKHPRHHFLVHKKDGKWQRGALHPTLETDTDGF